MCRDTASPVLPQTLQMGIKHFSGLFVLLCVGFGLSILTTIGEHIVYRLLLPRIKNKSKLQYWLHTSQVSSAGTLCQVLLYVRIPSEVKTQGSLSTDKWRETQRGMAKHSGS